MTLKDFPRSTGAPGVPGVPGVSGVPGVLLVPCQYFHFNCYGNPSLTGVCSIDAYMRLKTHSLRCWLLLQMWLFKTVNSPNGVVQLGVDPNPMQVKAAANILQLWCAGQPAGLQPQSSVVLPCYWKPVWLLSWFILLGCSNSAYV